MRIAVLIIIGLIYSLSFSAQSVIQRIDEFLNIELDKFNIPNLELIVVSHDSIIYHNDYGEYTNAAKTYYLGSASKSLTAYGTLKLVQSGEVELETPISEILPTIIFSQYGERITVRHLLNHTSGISTISGFANLPSLKELESNDFHIKINSESGINHQYSNLNYSILGLVIEKFSDTSFQEYMQREVFDPLEMKNTFIGDRSENTGRVIDQYQYWGAFPVKSNQLHYSMTSIPAGFITSSAEDIGHYLMMNLSMGIYNNESHMDSNLMATMHTTWDKSDYGYAMGWKQGVYNGKKFYQHLGSTATSYSGIFLIPEEDLGFALLTNSNSLSFAEDLMEGILGIMTDGEPETASKYEYFLRWAVLLSLVVIVIRFILKLIIAIKGRSSVSRKKSWKDLIVYSLLFIGFIIAFPIMADIPFFTFIKIQPDIGSLIIFSFLSGILLSVVKLVFR